MQRKLSEIAEIPKILSSTLATVSQTFEMLKPNDLQQQQQLLQYQQRRKHSYDEDALDYELSGATAEQRLKLKAKGKAITTAAAKTATATLSGGIKLEYLAKDTTPESDYASEGNYESNEADTDDDYSDDDGDDDGDGDDGVTGNSKKSKEDGSEESAEELEENDKYIFRLKEMNINDAAGTEAAEYSYVTRLRPATPSQQQQQQQQQKQRKQYQHHQYSHDDVNVNTNDVRQNEANTYDEDDVDDSEEEDVITTRLVVGRSEGENETDEDDQDGWGGECEGDEDDEDEDFLTTTYTWNLRKVPKLQLNDDKESFDESVSVTDQIDMDDTDEEEKPNKKSRWCHDDDDLQEGKHWGQWAEEEGEEEEKFTEKLERSWPWADREKIIYKQSTCHLVRRRPLGLVEQRIKLLAKQNLSDSLQRHLH